MQLHLPADTPFTAPVLVAGSCFAMSLQVGSEFRSVLPLSADSLHGFCLFIFFFFFVCVFNLQAQQYDRIYVGGAVPAGPLYLDHMQELLRPGGIMVVPVANRLLRVAPPQPPSTNAVVRSHSKFCSLRLSCSLFSSFGASTLSISLCPLPLVSFLLSFLYYHFFLSCFSLFSIWCLGTLCFLYLFFSFLSFLFSSFLFFLPFFLFPFFFLFFFLFFFFVCGRACAGTICNVVFNDLVLPSDDETEVLFSVAERAAATLEPPNANGGKTWAGLGDSRRPLVALRLAAEAVDCLLRSQPLPPVLCIPCTDDAQTTGADPSGGGAQTASGGLPVEMAMTSHVGYNGHRVIAMPANQRNKEAKRLKTTCGGREGE